MLGFLPGPILGSLMLLLLSLNTVFWAIPVYFFSLLKLITPRGAMTRAVARCADFSAQSWVGCNKLISDTVLPTRYEVRGVEKLDPKAKRQLTQLLVSFCIVWLTSLASDNIDPAQSAA